MSLVVDIAEAVMAEINGGNFSQPLNAVRAYKPVYDLAEMAELHVTVVPKGVVTQAASRESTQYEISIDIAVQKKLSTGDNSEIDALMNLTDEIAEFLRNRKLAAFPAASWARTEHAAIYAPEHIEQFRQFTSVVTVFYKALKA